MSYTIMKKILSVAIVAMMILSLTATAFAATGVGDHTSVDLKADGSLTVYTHICALTLDEAGKIVGVDFDAIQVKRTANADSSYEAQSKRELGDAYGMKGISPIGKEYYEQMDALEDWCIGKTLEEVLNGAVEDADLKAGCTVYNGNMLMALQKAVELAK